MAAPSTSFRFTLWGLLLWALLVPGSAVQPAGMLRSNATRTRSPSLLSLFRMTLNSKFWSDDVMARVNDDWNLPEHVSTAKPVLKNYTYSGNLARYLGFTSIDAIHFPIPVNFIFIGFEQEGNHQLKLGREELEKWFQNIDHIVEHTRIPQLGESLSPFYRVRADGQQRHHLPLVSNVHYNYSVHAIELGSGVTRVIEKAITVFSRKDDPTDTIPGNQAIWQVDVDNMEHIFNSLVDYLQLNEAYNVFILNPRRDTSRGKYGYRRGLSESEMRYLGKDVQLKAQLLDTRRHYLHDVFAGVDKALRRPLYARNPMLRFAWTTANTLDTAQWVDSYELALEAHSQLMKGKSDVESTFFQAQQILLGQDPHIGSALKRYISTDIGARIKSDCLTDTWVGRKRWSFIDLTAGPFTWGPTVGGEGVRQSSSLPSAERSFENVTWNGDVRSDESLQNEVQELIQNRFTTLGEDGTPVIDMLMAELDVYEMFATNHCSGRKIRLDLCEELRERMEDVRDELGWYKSGDVNEEEQKKAAEVLKKIDDWNLFADIHEHVLEFSVSRDRFLSHLGDTLSSVMKHVLTTSTADGAFHFYEKIYFRIYIITEEKLKGRKLVVNEAALKDALLSLILPEQKFEFSIQKLALSEDSALDIAFSIARRDAIVPVLSLNGTERPSSRVYLDSQVLQYELQQLSLGEKRSGGRGVLEVPIFWLVQSGGPLFIDKHYLAKALPDMVIVVQSNHSSWESHLQCNNKSIVWDLSQPFSAAMAATAEHLAGLMPAHVTYHHAHKNAIQDWSWSTGCNPFSSTADGWYLSTSHSDAVARSYIVTALDESIQRVNVAIKRLVKEPTYAHTYATALEHEHALLRNYNAVVNSWKEIVKVGENLMFQEAMKRLGRLEDKTSKFQASVEEIISAFHPIHCTRQHKIDKGANTFVGVGIAATVLGLWLLLRPRHRKPKLN